MPSIEKIVFNVCDPEAQIRFYTEILGMAYSSCNGSVGYRGLDASLSFLPRQAGYQPATNDLYWKIALGVRNIEMACEQLQQRGVTVGEPHQFGDIGYLAHFKDPEGFTIELIEHWFEGNRQEKSHDSGLLGGGAHLNLLTLRTADIEHIKIVVSSLGMKALSVQPVEGYGFTLYFFAFTEESPPNRDLYSVENREWLYQRPYTVLEFQHLHSPEEILRPDSERAGYEGVVISDIGEFEQADELRVIVDTPSGS